MSAPRIRRLAAALTLVSLIAGTAVVLTAHRVRAADAWGTYSLTFEGTAAGRGGVVGASGGLVGFDGGPGDVAGRLDDAPSAAAQASSIEPGTIYRLVAGQANDASGEEMLGEPTTARAEFPGDTTEDDATQAEPPSAGPLTIVGARSRAKADPARAVAVADVGAFTAAGADGEAPMLEVLGAFGEGRAVADPGGDLVGRVTVGADEVRILGDQLVLTDVVGTAEVGAAGDARTAIADLTVGGITVAGTPVELGDDGLVVAGEEAVPGSELGAVGGQVNAVLEAAGIHLVAIESRETTDATRASASSGGIGITVVTPSSSGVPRNEFSIVIGGATATLYAEAPVVFEDTPVAPVTPAPDPPPTDAPDTTGVAPAPVPAPTTADGPVTVGLPTPSASPSAPPPAVADGAPSAETGDGGAPERMVVAGQIMSARTAYAGFASWLLFTSLIPLAAARWLRGRSTP